MSMRMKRKKDTKITTMKEMNENTETLPFSDKESDNTMNTRLKTKKTKMAMIKETNENAETPSTSDKDSGHMMNTRMRTKKTKMEETNENTETLPFIDKDGGNTRNMRMKPKKNTKMVTMEETNESTETSAFSDKNSGDASMRMKAKKNRKLTAMEDTETPSFSEKEYLIKLLKAFFQNGPDPSLLFDILPGKSTEERRAAIELTFQKVTDAMQNRPSMVNWLSGGLFEENDYKVPLALLFFSLYEQCPRSAQEEVECDFREIYWFLYKITLNQSPPHLSRDSAKVLHRLLSELIEEVWPSARNELVNFLTGVHNYSRPPVRRTYSRNNS